MKMRKVSFKCILPKEVRQKLKLIYQGRIIMYKDEDILNPFAYCVIIASYTVEHGVIESAVHKLGECYGFIPNDISIYSPTDCLIGLNGSETILWLSIKCMNQKEVESLFSDPRCVGHIFY